MRSFNRVAAALGALSFASCSFIVGGDGFKECTNDTECASDKACLKSKTDDTRYCVPMPDLCRREVGAFDDPNYIPIGAPLPLTAGGLPDAGGVPDDSETGSLNAYKLAIEEFNVRTIDGRKFGLYVCNTGRVASVINQQATWLTDHLGARALLFSGSGQGIEAHKVTSPRNVLLMSATATSPELINVHQTSGLIWRTAPPDSLQGKVLTDFLQNDPAFSTVSKVGVVYVDDAYGQGLNSVIQKSLPSPRYTVRSIPYVEGEPLDGAVLNLSLFAPELTVLIAFRAEAKEILRLAAARTNLNASSGHRWMFTDSAKDPAIITSESLPMIQNAFGFAPAQGAGSAYRAFESRYISKFNTNPADYSFLSHSYDAMYVLGLAYAYAFGAGGGTPDGQTLRQGIEKVSAGTPYTLEPTNLSGMLSAMKSGTGIDIEGASGKLNFNPDAGAPSSPIERWQIMPDGGIEFRDLSEPPLNL